MNLNAKYPQIQYQQQGPYPLNATMESNPQENQQQQRKLPDAIGAVTQVAAGTKQAEPKAAYTQESIDKIIRMNEFYSTKIYQKDQDDNPSPDTIASMSEGLFQATIPAEKRLTIIPITVNGIKLAGLYDTGATITMAPLSVAERAGIDLEENNVKVQSVTGHVAVSGKKGSAKMSIGRYKRNVGINFVEDDQLGTENPYDVIIGLDVMRNFPKVILDARKRTLTIGEGGQHSEISFKTKGEMLQVEGKVHTLKEIYETPNEFIAASRELNQEIEGKSESIKGNFQPSHRPGRYRKPMCYNCRLRGHLAASCPNETKARASIKVTCGKCQERGYHEMDPNQRMTFQEWKQLNSSIVREKREMSNEKAGDGAHHADGPV
jgi:hypothetical protein